MFQERDGEKEILLGNKQLLGIFFVLAILFGVFFTAGYMVGRTTGEKKPVETAAAATSTPAETASANGGENHAVSPDPTTASSELSSGSEAKASSDAEVPKSAAKTSVSSNDASQPKPVRKSIPEKT